MRRSRRGGASAMLLGARGRRATSRRRSKPRQRSAKPRHVRRARGGGPPRLGCSVARRRSATASMARTPRAVPSGWGRRLQGTTRRGLTGSRRARTRRRVGRVRAESRRPGRTTRPFSIERARLRRAPWPGVGGCTRRRCGRGEKPVGASVALRSRMRRAGLVSSPSRRAWLAPARAGRALRSPRAVRVDADGTESGRWSRANVPRRRPRRACRRGPG